MDTCGIPDCEKEPVEGFTLCAEHNARVERVKADRLASILPPDEDDE